MRTGGSAIDAASREGRTVHSRPMHAIIQTNHGPIHVELFPEDAPKTVNNFVKLANDGFYDRVIFHRVIPDFMIQGGDPTGTGSGGPGYSFEDEFNDHKVERGALAMANAGPNTNGSQFFIVTTEAAPWLDGKHTVFGRVTEGMDVVDKISELPRDTGDKPHDDVVMESVSVADGPA
jgi:peptidyl-prolyl cis-trans isomerase B (cyclophilin B)